MSEISILIVALLVGILLGGMFYGGLWWTVCHNALPGYRGFWWIGSFLLRALIAGGGFYWVARDDARALPACLLGFFIARICVTCLTGTPLMRKNGSIQGAEP